MGTPSAFLRTFGAIDGAVRGRRARGSEGKECLDGAGGGGGRPSERGEAEPHAVEAEIPDAAEGVAVRAGADVSAGQEGLGAREGEGGRHAPHRPEECPGPVWRGECNHVFRHMYLLG